MTMSCFNDYCNTLRYSHLHASDAVKVAAEQSSAHTYIDPHSRQLGSVDDMIRTSSTGLFSWQELAMELKPTVTSSYYMHVQWIF